MGFQGSLRLALAAWAVGVVLCSQWAEEEFRSRPPGDVHYQLCDWTNGRQEALCLAFATPGWFPDAADCDNVAGALSDAGMPAWGSLSQSSSTCASSWPAIYQGGLQSALPPNNPAGSSGLTYYCLQTSDRCVFERILNMAWTSFYPRANAAFSNLAGRYPAGLSNGFHFKAWMTSSCVLGDNFAYNKMPEFGSEAAVGKWLQVFDNRNENGKNFPTVPPSPPPPPSPSPPPPLDNYGDINSDGYGDYVTTVSPPSPPRPPFQRRPARVPNPPRPPPNPPPSPPPPFATQTDLPATFAIQSLNSGLCLALPLASTSSPDFSQLVTSPITKPAPTFSGDCRSSASLWSLQGGLLRHVQTQMVLGWDYAAQELVAASGGCEARLALWAGFSVSSAVTRFAARTFANADDPTSVLLQEASLPGWCVRAANDSDATAGVSAVLSRACDQLYKLVPSGSDTTWYGQPSSFLENANTHRLSLAYSPNPDSPTPTALVTTADARAFPLDGLLWTVSQAPASVGASYFSIQSQPFGKYLTDSGLASNSLPQLEDYSAVASLPDRAYWALSAVAAGATPSSMQLSIRNKASARYLSDSGQVLDLTQPASSAAQPTADLLRLSQTSVPASAKWLVAGLPAAAVPSTASRFTFSSLLSGLCLRAPRSGARDGSVPTFGTCSGPASDSYESYWRFDDRGDLVHVATGLCLRAAADGSAALSSQCQSPLYSYVGSGPFVLRERNAPNRCLQPLTLDAGQPLVFSADCPTSTAFTAASFSLRTQP